MSSEDDVKKENVELHERVARLEIKVEELTKRVDGIIKYIRELYGYLQKEHRRPLI